MRLTLARAGNSAATISSASSLKVMTKRKLDQGVFGFYKPETLLAFPAVLR